MRSDNLLTVINSRYDEAHVALVAGGAFGMSPYLRISYATDDASLEEAMRRMGSFVASLT